MRIPQEILEVITKEEAEQLVRLYPTDLFEAYLRKLKEKYYKMYEYLQDIDDE